MQSLSLASLTPLWVTISFGVGIGNSFCSLRLHGPCVSHYSSSLTQAHTAAKSIFMCLFRHSQHVYSPTWLDGLGRPTPRLGCHCLRPGRRGTDFSDSIGIGVALFAAWFTYGIAGFFWLHDADVYYLEGGVQGGGLWALFWQS